MMTMMMTTISSQVISLISCRGNGTGCNKNEYCSDRASKAGSSAHSSADDTVPVRLQVVESCNITV